MHTCVNVHDFHIDILSTLSIKIIFVKSGLKAWVCLTVPSNFKEASTSLILHSNWYGHRRRPRKPYLIEAEYTCLDKIQSGFQFQHRKFESSTFMRFCMLYLVRVQFACLIQSWLSTCITVLHSCNKKKIVQRFKSLRLR